MKRILAVILSVVLLLAALPLGMVSVSAADQEVDLEEVFQSNLNFLDQYYTLGPEFMAQKLCGMLYDWELAEANDFADQPMPAAEFEEILYRYFAPAVDLLADLRSYQLYDWKTNSYYPFYNSETGMYNIFFVGGFGGDLPQRQYQRYLTTENGYTVFYQHITYDFLPMTPEMQAELEALHWPMTYTYDGKVYENGPEGYYRIASLDDYGNKYEVEYNDGILRILSQTPYTAASENDFKYTITDGEVTITKYVGAGGDVIIPSKLGGYPVTVIGKDAFKYRDFLTSVMIPEGVTTIQESSFNMCKDLKYIGISKSVLTIEKFAFKYCGLLRVDVPTSVISIGEEAFKGCGSLTLVNIEGNTAIGAWAFYGGSMTQVIIGDGAETIGENAFGSCQSLISVVLPKSIVKIYQGAFYDCRSLEEVYYAGSEEERKLIDIGYSNNKLSNATWHYNWDVSPVIPGDSSGDGEVSIQDVALFQRYLNGWDEELDAVVCDVNADGACDNKDLVLLIRYLNGWDVELVLPN